VVHLTLIVKKRSLWLKGVKLYLDNIVPLCNNVLPSIFSFSFMSGPNHDVEAWFDYYVVYDNNVPLSHRRWNFLAQQVARLEHDIPFYVCVLTSSDADECKSRMVGTCTYFLYLVSQINIP
jgi:hypothetical protein